MKLYSRLLGWIGILTKSCVLPQVFYQLAEVIVAEVGTDLSPFPRAKHLASWAGLCPGNNQCGS